MQTLQFTRMLQRIVAELKAREIPLFLATYLRPPVNTAIQEQAKAQFSTLVVQSISGFANLSNNPDAKKILDTFQISELYAAPRLGRLIGAFHSAGQTQNLITNTEIFPEMSSFTSMLSWLAKIADGCQSLLENERIPKSPEGTEIVELEIISDDGKGVEVERLKRFFSSLIELHTQIALLLGSKDSRLEIAYVDSGSITVGLVAALPVIVFLKKLFQEVWQEIKYGPFENLNKKLDSVSKVLTLTKEIETQVESKALSENEGEALKHRILNEVFAIIEVGAMLPVQDAVEEKEQRRLLAEHRTKLLGTGPPPPHE